jgi:hypothetical protein
LSELFVPREGGAVRRAILEVESVEEGALALEGMDEEGLGALFGRTAPADP